MESDNRIKIETIDQEWSIFFHNMASANPIYQYLDSTFLFSYQLFVSIFGTT